MGLKITEDYNLEYGYRYRYSNPCMTGQALRVPGG
jgi:hypothetical protein